MRLPKRVNNFAAHPLNDQIDRIIDAINALTDNIGGGAELSDFAFNNSSVPISKYTICGRDAAGLLVPAVATEPGKIEPMFQVLRTIQPGQSGPAKTIGSSRVIMESPGEVIPARGAWGWLSTTVPGKVTATKPTNGWAFICCNFAETTVDDDGTAACWLYIFMQGSLVI